MNRWINSWRLSLLVARRQVRRSKARNALIIAMLALPVLGTVGIDTVISSATQLTPAEKVARSVGGFDAFVEPSLGAPIQQNLDASVAVRTDMLDGQGGTSAAAPSAAALRRALPDAALVQERLADQVGFSAAAGPATGSYWQVDLGDPRTAGVFDVVAGRVPRTPGEIDLSPALAADLGVAVGQQVTLASTSAADRQAARFRVVGLLEQPNSTRDTAAFALPTAAAANGSRQAGWFVTNPGGVSWNQVLALNRLGYPVVSRKAVLDPTAASQAAQFHWIAYSPLGGAVHVAASSVPAAVFGIAIGVGLLEVVLLAGPAFAVSARRREREYALLGAVGADGRQLRRIVLADGVVLGVIAGVAGVGLGYGCAAAVLPFVSRIDGQLPGAVHVSALHAVGVAVLAVVLGLCSALVPARGVVKREIMATLSGRFGAGGRRTRVTRRRRLTGVGCGLGLVGVGLTCEYFGANISAQSAQVLITGGIALIEIGGIVCTPALVAGLASLCRVLPLGPRLALRDSARHSTRTTPAVAAMFAAVAGAVAAGTWLDSSFAQQQAQYTPLLLPHQIAIRTPTADAPKVLNALRTVLPDVSSSTILTSVGGYQQPATASSLWSVSALPPGLGVSCVPGVTKVPARQGYFDGCGAYIDPTGYDGELIGDATTLREVTGIEDAAVGRVLAQGGIVVTEPDLVDGGQIRLAVQHQTTAPHATEATQTTVIYTLPAAYVNVHGKPNPGFVISPAGARTLGLDQPALAQDTVLFDLAKPLTAQQRSAADAALGRLHVPSELMWEPGMPQTRSLINLIVLGFTVFLALAAAAIATGLALADGRADQDTLTAVGGSPWTRRWLAGSTALVVTGLGVLIGVPLGFVIAAGLIRANNLHTYVPGFFNSPGWTTMPFTVPWLNLGAMVVAVPLLTAAGAMLLSRSQAPGGKPRLD